ncbi:cytochrome ubiquinol oxidase subunit I [Aneurinibacillus uraniidurans]|uniref:cytochrome ubiquinol oxidase subunit I n=1 Tax=Aneurinibacillus uraniidurans TaxID=2966586 RepID=UPI00234B3CEC|nr:cytochrome ubiquinol oxidase subunit I [Aneurinibacillus sp. B1]WCN39209.1 cytochrome ubiquinol oxidase subunit I [Aneurinibacillus sp. B1]
MTSVIMLSRIQFAVTVFYHFLFVPLTIGLVILVAYMETQYARTRQPLYRQMADFWGKLFSINFVLGVVTGITMEFQFGTNWSEYSKYMGDIFGSPLAIEALVAFFLESTFMGLWLFGRDKISPKMRAFSIWMVAIGTNISALWIITANGFMQHPVGYVIRNGRAELNSFYELVTNSYAWYMFFHTVVASYIVGSFFVMGISAYHLIRKQNVPFFEKSFSIALALGLLAATATPFIGHEHGVHTAEKQPAKAAAMEAVWETQQSMPFSIISIPDPKNERNIEALSIPYMGSFFYTNNFTGKVTGLKDIPADERPNVNLVFYSFRSMVALGMYFLALVWYGFYLVRKNQLVSSSRYLKVVLYSMLLPYVAINLGWVVAEAGRQPWVVYGLMKTVNAISPISVSQVIFSLLGLVLFYSILIIADVILLVKYAKSGPKAYKEGKGELQHVS